jgi:hypothetical protein
MLYLYHAKVSVVKREQALRERRLSVREGSAPAYLVSTSEKWSFAMVSD